MGYAKKEAQIKADVIQKAATGGMFFELFGWFMTAIMVFGAYSGCRKFNNWAEQKIGRSPLSDAEFFKTCLSTAVNTVSIRDQFSLFQGMYEMQKIQKSTYNEDGTLNKELGAQYAEYYFENLDTVKKYNKAIEELKVKANLTESGSTNWIDEKSLDGLRSLSKSNGDDLSLKQMSALRRLNA